MLRTPGKKTIIIFKLGNKCRMLRQNIKYPLYSNDRSVNTPLLALVW